MIGWAVKWSSGPNNVDGKLNEYLVHFDHVDPKCAVRHIAFFKTRKAARAWAKQRYGYIAARRDLRRYPHDWRPVTVVRATLEVKEVTNDDKRRGGGPRQRRTS